MADNDYPEHQKLKAVKDQSQVIGSFLDHMYDIGLYLCERDNENELYETHKRIEVILAEYFEIDLNKLEDEKEKMLNELRTIQNL